ncbi:phospholipase D beta 1-like protein [Tanacetum coccineum]|uniref:phospholipase D n=1 Tax=Tanacetum coccineum TaxID=301880 RepID=A0ABQ4YLJ0_9ASTR
MVVLWIANLAFDPCERWGLGANNLIPMEITLKIVDKIRANERFATYIVIPMWPEGSPTSTVTQCILFWQALEEVGVENVYEPQDYLMFFCLGTRESSHGVVPTSNEKGSNAAIANTPQSLKKNRRFMIGVHSKGMIVDDEFVIMGSANINQRSLEGTRDTKTAMGAYQPYHTWANKDHRVTDMKSRLLKYPVEVDCDGQVKPLHGCPNFPDIGGSIDLNIDPSFTWKNFNLEEQAKVIIAPRSNNELDATKLKTEFPEFLSIKESLVKYVFEPNRTTPVAT